MLAFYFILSRLVFSDFKLNKLSLLFKVLQLLRSFYMLLRQTYWGYWATIIGKYVVCKNKAESLKITNLYIRLLQCRNSFLLFRKQLLRVFVRSFLQSLSAITFIEINLFIDPYRSFVLLENYSSFIVLRRAELEQWMQSNIHIQQLELYWNVRVQRVQRKSKAI